MIDAEIVWDLEDDPDGNVQHIAEHGLSIDEVESVLLERKNQFVFSRESGRRITFGWTDSGLHIAVVWEVVNDDPKMIRVVTAYEVEPRSK
jgi:uncharacterized DUF497 family protein